MTKKPPAAFMCYVHSDNKYEHLTTLRERLSDEVQVQTGIEFPIFQDTKDIHFGQNWAQRIQNSLLDEVTFLIAIITPSYFKSEACRSELTRFLEREKKVGRNDLILPIYFVDTPLLNDPELRATDELAEVIASRQYADWRDLRFEPFTNPQVGKRLEQVAQQIRNALLRIQTTKKTPAKTDASKVQPTATTTRGSGEEVKESPTAKNEPPTAIVDPNREGDFTTITEAIKRVEPGSRILIRPGRYEEGLLVDKPLEIIGDGKPGEVEIQAAGIDVILFQTTMGRIGNLTLRQMGGGQWFCVNVAQGRLDLEDCDISSQSLTCVAIHGGADPRLRRNRIHDSKEGGVVVYENAQGTLEDNEIFNNVLAGVEIKEGADPTLRHNRIHENTGGGVYVHEGGQGTLEDNDIFSDTLSEVAITTTGNPTVRRNRIYDSKQGSGVYVDHDGQGTIEDNEIFGNRNSGVASRSSKNLVVRKNRINKNSDFGVYVSEKGGGTFENNDVTGNAKGAWFIAEDSKANVARTNNKE